MENFLEFTKVDGLESDGANSRERLTARSLNRIGGYSW